MHNAKHNETWTINGNTTVFPALGITVKLILIDGGVCSVDSWDFNGGGEAARFGDPEEAMKTYRDWVEQIKIGAEE